MLLHVSRDWWTRAFVVLGFVFYAKRRDGLGERLRNYLLCVEWNLCERTEFRIGGGLEVDFAHKIGCRGNVPRRIEKSNFRSFNCSHSSTIRANRASLKIGQNRQREEGKTSIFVSPPSAAKLVAALLRVAGVTAGLMESNGSRIYDSRHLQADCREPGSAPEPYAR